MFRRKLIPVWLGIVLLSGMFLMGQETWPPQGPTSPIPDTGITECYDNTQVIECPPSGQPFYGQDAQYATNPMSYTVSPDGLTVGDNVTGLLWQREDDNQPRYWTDAMDFCENLTLGASSDWRLPNVKELQTVLDYGHYDPAVDPAYFPGTHSAFFWSSTTNSEGPSQAFTVDFDYGYIYSQPKASVPSYVRCVSGQEMVEQIFLENGNGTVTDILTGLMWQKEDDNQGRNWEPALAYCEGIELGGHADWRLPDVKELQSIVDFGRVNPPVDPAYFPNTVNSFYWTSSPYVSNANAAWDIQFYYGEVSAHGKVSVPMYVRCVR